MPERSSPSHGRTNTTRKPRTKHVQIHHAAAKNKHASSVFSPIFLRECVTGVCWGGPGRAGGSAGRRTHRRHAAGRRRSHSARPGRRRPPAATPAPPCRRPDTPATRPCRSDARTAPERTDGTTFGGQEENGALNGVNCLLPRRVFLGWGYRANRCGRVPDLSERCLGGFRVCGGVPHFHRV